MDSDEEYDRRRGRDKFRRERSDYNDRRERDDRRRGGEDWGDRRRDRGEVRRDWNRRDYNDYDRGGRRDRYSPPRGRDMSPPNKRMRRDWGDGGGYQGGFNDMGYGGGPGGGFGGGQQGGWGQGRGRNRGRGGGPDIDPTGPMMSFKAFLAAQDDNIDQEAAKHKYNEYKMEYKKAQLSEFFLAHKDEEWFRFKYYPDEAEKRHQETLAAVHHRLVVFLDVFQRGLVDEAKADADTSQQIIKLLDAAVIKMEGGTELDMTILDQPPSPKSTPSRQRSTSERSRRASEMSEKGPKGSEDKKAATDGEDGELKEEDEQDEKKEKTDEEKKDEEPEKEKKEEDEEKKEEPTDQNGDKEDGEEKEEDEKEKDESKEKEEKSKEEKDEEEKKEDTPAEPKETPQEPVAEKQKGPTLEEKKQQHSVSEVLKKLMMGGHKADKDKERSPRHDRKRKRKRDYSSDESHSGSSSDSFTSSSSGSSSDSSDSEDERHDRDTKSKKHRKNSKASEGKPTDKESGEIKDGKEEGEEKEEGEKEPEEPKARALHKTYSLFVRNVAPVITKAEIMALCKRYPGFMRVALAEPQAERNFQRHGWITFDRSVNIKEICWNLSSIRLRDCELSPVVNRELSNRVRSVSGITAHKTVIRSDLKLAARLVQQLDDKNKLWRDDFVSKEKEKKDKELKEKEGEEQQKEEPSEDLVAKFKRNPVLDNITEYLVEEASAEEEVLLGASADPSDLDSSKDSTAEVTFEKDDELNKVLDRLLFYLRIVHSVDYYTGSQYHIEDEMPNRCGIMHVRGSNPPNRITEKDLDNWEKHFEGKLASLLNTASDLPDDEVFQLGKKDQEAEVEKFVKANTQELGKDKWLCPLSGKKFKGPEFVRKHIFNKHGDKVEDVKKEVTFFNNYLKDPRRPHLPDPQSNKPTGNQQGGPGGGPEQRQGGGSWGSGGFNQQSGYGGGYNQQGGRGGFNQGQAQGHGGQQNFSNRGFNQRYNQGGQSHGADRNTRPSRGNSGRGRSRGDPRPLIQYRDLDAPDDNDFF
ncbi:LOW QUALITY PROTEIN: serrate RNA effector molecule homolog [Amphiura filiformis]|uniref:LOW QUALITY PROTEIN: serrate RNA effector molecule homolog n=1 Tax=Amphiura filiformis TaxID=82378 RepID=UPI003B20C62C